MRIAVIIVRIVMGLLFLFAAVMYFFFPHAIEAPPLKGDFKIFNEGLTASGYIMPVSKVLELVCGIALVTGFFVPLAAVVIFPITINIFCVHALLEPTGLPVAVALLAANIFLLYAKRDHYRAILTK